MDSGRGRDDELFGYAGDDKIYGEEGSDTLRGGDGNDTLVGDLGGGVGAGNDSLFGDAGDDNLSGGGGNDFLDGGTGTDTMRGGEGDDTYYVDSTADIVLESANKGANDLVWMMQSVSTPKAAQTLRGLPLIGLRWCANRLDVLPARACGDWLASHACLQAANDEAFRLVA